MIKFLYDLWDWSHDYNCRHQVQIIKYSSYFKLKQQIQTIMFIIQIIQTIIDSNNY